MNTDAWLEKAVIRLYRARKSRDEAKSKLRATAERLGSCDNFERLDSVRCFERGNKLPQEAWCDVCKEKQPLWQAYHKASTESGTALKAILRYAKQLTE